MSKLSPQEFQQKHAARLKAAIPDITAGVNKVTTAPGTQAAAASAKMLNNLTAKVQDGTWARRVGSVSLTDWQQKMTTKGVQRIAGGIDAASAKVIEFATQFLPFQDGVTQQTRAMPSMTLEDSIARMTNQVRGTAKFQRK